MTSDSPGAQPPDAFASSACRGALAVVTAALAGGLLLLAVLALAAPQAIRPAQAEMPPLQLEARMSVAPDGVVYAPSAGVARQALPGAQVALSGLGLVAFGAFLMNVAARLRRAAGLHRVGRG